MFHVLSAITLRVSQVSEFPDNTCDQPRLNSDELADNVQQKVPNHYQPQPYVFHISTQCNSRTMNVEISFAAIRKLTAGINGEAIIQLLDENI